MSALGEFAFSEDAVASGSLSDAGHSMKYLADLVLIFKLEIFHILSKQLYEYHRKTVVVGLTDRYFRLIFPSAKMDLSTWVTV